MSAGSVSPWPTSVARITQKVRKMTRSRCGNRTSIGRARAAARETAPRMPAHEMTKTAFGDGLGSRSRMDLLRRRGR